MILSKFYCNRTTNEKVDIYLKEEKANIKYNFSSVGSGYDKYIMSEVTYIPDNYIELDDDTSGIDAIIGQTFNLNDFSMNIIDLI